MFTTPETRVLAQDVLDYIEAHPENHDQRSVNACGTNMCIAGTAAWLVYGHKAEETLWPGDSEEYPEYVGLEKMGPHLGLDRREIDDLFFGTMDNDEAVQKLKHIIVGEPWAIPEPNYDY